MTAARLLTDLGDFAVASPTAAAVAIWLRLQVNRTIALVFAGAFVCLVAVVGALKVFAHAAAPAYQAGELWELSTGAPSGHTALAALVYGAGALILLRLGRGASRIAGVGLSGVAILTVAVTRVTLRHHTIGDVMAGLLVGVAFTGLFGRALTTVAPAPAPHTAWLFAALVVVPALALASGLRMPSTAFM